MQMKKTFKKFTLIDVILNFCHKSRYMQHVDVSFHKHFKFVFGDAIFRS